ncbi:glycine radical domain-containing protein [Muricomes intestini]|jgi:formate C-acetyltransferase|uniref:Glycine radical enzyme n=1 Tax=Muricomes intestini TaxID=1796634 RepID=A0A4V6NYS6_9FIRM|nr:glycine radical domain-containing protein [Muricomes intestini]TCS73586.1 glycine radical enzyme [Muricomes intestini]HAX51536.1 autonomous glycyl radical cofactor GrcA [Lachnospiraceae bacterium]HCR82517.1 autonomous glycyl radical cofactor GrcA [Lachnospiraceae bacterium]
MENTIQVNKNDGLKRFVSIIDQYFAMGGNQIQFNVVSKKTLLDAQKDPDKYANLLVRVAGYSAYFTQLSKDVQEDIIARTEEKL